MALDLKSPDVPHVLYIRKPDFFEYPYSQTVYKNFLECFISQCALNCTRQTVHIKVKVNQSRYRPGVAQRVPGS